MYNAALTVALPPHTARLPRKAPESLLSGATPTKAASCLGGRLPSSGSSAKSVLATTGPTPGTPRKSSSFSRQQVGLLAIALRALPVCPGEALATVRALFTKRERDDPTASCGLFGPGPEPVCRARPVDSTTADNIQGPELRKLRPAR
jgi:hypothetical protein